MEARYDKRKHFVVNAIYFLLILVISYLFLRYGISMVSPFLFAFVFAYLLKKPSRAIAKATNLPNRLVSFLVILIFYTVTGFLMIFLGLRFISTITRYIAMIPGFYENQIWPILLNLSNEIQEIFYDIDPAVVDFLNETLTQLLRTLGETVTNISIGLLAWASNFATTLPPFFIKVLLMVISTFFIAIDFDELVAFIERQFSKKGNEIIDTIQEYIVNTLFVVIRSYIMIMTITFVELAIGLSILGIKNAIFIAFLIAIFDILPVLGTGGIMIPWTLFTFIQGNYTLGFGLLVVYLVVTIVRNIIEPKIVGSQLGLHPVVTLISMFVGVNLLGPIGLFGFPITLSLLNHLNETGTIKIFK